MPKPENVNPKKFSVIRVLYDDSDFSVAWGRWNDTGENSLGMRWNGDDSGDAGYPKTFGNPMWFLIPEALSATFIQSLLGQQDSKTNPILDTLREII